MKMKLILTLAFLLLAAPGAFAQAAGGAGTKVKVAIVDVLIFREEVLELKAKYEKLTTEFAPKARDLESMNTSIVNKQKVLQENKTLTPQQGQKLNDEIEQLKKEYNRLVQDSQDLAQKREQAETGAIYEKLSKFLDGYCAKHGITTVFDARRLQETGVVVYAAPIANITRDFISEYNKANPVQTAAK
ncbi:MAG TPA: OmpH family outer membrane protein [Blastocatellia bacterium]|nr:OmpH family outer membrane protein [Blastocatellia bacterium]